MKNPFWPLAAKMYQKFKPVIHKKQNQKIRRELWQLYPSKNIEKLYDNYQIRKLAAVLAVWTIGIVSAACLSLCSRREDNLAEGAQLNRNEWGAGDYEAALLAKTEKWSRKLSFLVKERRLTEEEINKLSESLRQELPKVIKKNNQDLQHVNSDLYLPSSVDGYPFKLTWTSADADRLDNRGRINRTGISDKGQMVELTVTAVYEEKRISFTYEIILLPEVSSEEEDFFRILEKELQDIAQREETDKVIALPEKLNGRQIEWEEITADNRAALVLVLVLAGIIVCLRMDDRLKRNCDKRKKQLLKDYAGFVSKLRLYLSAGLNVKNAFIKMAADYGQRQGKKEFQYLYEELKTVCHQFENGMAEEQVYQEFGKRCGEMRYRRLSFLLSVHLKQGNSQLLILLENEADSALKERRNLAKKAGEEAGTKLLFPMMLMLMVVMLFILLPAYFNFGNV